MSGKVFAVFYSSSIITIVIQLTRYCDSALESSRTAVNSVAVLADAATVESSGIVYRVPENGTTPGPRRQHWTKIDSGPSAGNATSYRYHATVGAKTLPAGRNVSSTDKPRKGTAGEGHAFFDDDDDDDEDDYYDEDEADGYENSVVARPHDDGNEENDDGQRVDEETEDDGQQVETDAENEDGESETDTKPSIILRTKKRNYKKRKRGKKHGVKIKVKGLKKLQKFMLPLLLAYKLKFLTLVPLLLGGLVLIVATTGFAGFFFALFAVGLGMKHH